ncbi:MAG: membrane protein insertion efficiency factor YidD [Omnitrophica bacterium RIFCSPHIGHO2_02_FULL_49_9]|nr:MAG: membrane protein insertion efficiency factor YidD [Omnitrophica bacterium RIFCSPHIGHO2_02_FULL_49_9]
MKQTVLGTIDFYRGHISPFLGIRCRFTPSCSQYAHEAVREMGILRGALKTIGRLFRCHPLCSGGYDPVTK